MGHIGHMQIIWSGTWFQNIIIVSLFSHISQVIRNVLVIYSIAILTRIKIQIWFKVI